MTEGQKDAVHIITNDCIKKRIIDSIAIGLRLDGTITEETFVKL